MNPAISVGDIRHYTPDRIQGRHLLKTAKQAGVSEAPARAALVEVAESTEAALTAEEAQLPPDFPKTIPSSVSRGLRSRMTKIC
jgi:serine/threonine-protein kinase HipA